MQVPGVSKAERKGEVQVRELLELELAMLFPRFRSADGSGISSLRVKKDTI